MRPWLFAMLAAPRVRTVQTFTASTTWVAPLTTSTVDMAGHGANGAPGTNTLHGWYEITSTTRHRLDGGNDVSASQGASVFDGSATPGNYCDPTVSTPGDPVYSGYTVCHNFFSTTQPGTPDIAGAAASGIGKTFPGGADGPATLVNFPNVGITPGSSYPLSIPSGGSITLTYWK